MLTAETRSVVVGTRSSIGQKALMAASGAVLFLFVAAHMVGNLKVFTGRTHFDDYAGFLRDVGRPALGHTWFLWIQRTVLLAAVVVHIATAYRLSRQSRRARPVRYSHPATVEATYASRTMRWGGVIIALFVVYHLLNLTTGTVHPDFHHGRVYDNVVADFRVWYVSVVYIAAVLALGLHLDHGLWSALQTLGRNRPGRERRLRRASRTVAGVIVAGYLSVPLAVMVGVVR
jgi:succinate dehydrogenase / fumarate reductase cytochrome b subunit